MRPTYPRHTNSKGKVITRDRYALHAILTMMTISMVSMFSLASMLRRQIILCGIRNIPTSLQRLRTLIHGIKLRQTSLTLRGTRTFILAMLMTLFGRRLRAGTSTRRQLPFNFFFRSQCGTHHLRLNRNVNGDARTQRSRPINFTSNIHINNSSHFRPRLLRTKLRTRRITRTVVSGYSRADDPFIRKVSSL